ncbi:ABC transporter substrate-binding protein [Natronococcus sp. A-GB7]|uniref:ABC transporter substrate-binding protein n=1 Tax=Natronococcus sp. A-GB7 TaxID=3037649 RepID=UPI00241CD257|nr:ABC transporter substrate-binding protein [Natronococcus sp. A-GB7]MDG5821396.1 ABC transporter substrate-binding protein [Natronococcus sp. A-GB7]
MPKSGTERNDAVSRRTVMQAIGGAGTVGLAGCLSGDDMDGERVPTLQIEYWGDYGGYTTIQEQMAVVIERNLEDHLGVDVDLVPVDLSTQTSQQYNDENRDCDVSFTWWVGTPDRLDPNELYDNLRLDWAGANGQSNSNNWANCEFTELQVNQVSADTEEERDEMLTDAMGVVAEECVCIDICPVANVGAWRTDKVEVDGIGDAGIARSNAEWAFKSELIDSDEDYLVIGTDPQATETTNFPTLSASMPEAQWQHMIHSPIHKYDENYDPIDLLGEVEVVGPQEVVVELFDDATFTNGDQITAEDVKFTFEQIERGADAGAYPGAADVPYEAITAVDEQTCQFEFSEPYLPFAETTLMRWGIWHEETFEEAGAVDDPGEASFELPLVSSGPLEVTELEPGQRFICEPHGGHPVYEPGQPIVFEAFADEETMMQGIESGECHIAPEISPPNADRANEEIDDAESAFEESHTTFLLQPASHIAPGKFTEFRQAMAAVLNRQEMIDIAYGGEVDAELYGTFISEVHPMHPSEGEVYQMADDSSGDPEQGRQILEEAGWEWDSNDNLYYPPDADLDPLWEEGDVPSADEFPCIDELGLDP